MDELFARRASANDRVFRSFAAVPTIKGAVPFFKYLAPAESADGGFGEPDFTSWKPIDKLLRQLDALRRAA